MHYDVVIIGAGMSGLAAGLRLAYYDKRVCIVERHYAYGGLNSYYKCSGREFDVGLHAVTNYSPPGTRSAPLAKLLRQLRLKFEDLDLHPQGYSEIRFPSRTLRFTNDIEVLVSEVAREFPRAVDGFRRLVAHINEYDDTRLEQTYQSARAVLRDYLGDKELIEMLLCPMMYYGNADEHDMDFTQFVTIFKGILCEGMARPRAGIRGIIRVLVKKFRGYGGRIMMGQGVQHINTDGNRATGVTLTSGDTLSCDTVISSAGYHETMRLCGGAGITAEAMAVGRISFVETIAVLSKLPHELGHRPTIVFFNDSDTFHYCKPDGMVDLRSGVVCCPSNYTGHEDMTEGILRVTWMANSDCWFGVDETAYRSAKEACYQHFLTRAAQYIPDFRQHIVFSD
ncbi:MAG: phytoene desaturase family protein, partial [Phycisphaerae bacterium]